MGGTSVGRLLGSAHCSGFPKIYLGRRLLRLSLTGRVALLAVVPISILSGSTHKHTEKHPSQMERQAVRPQAAGRELAQPVGVRRAARKAFSKAVRVVRAHMGRSAMLAARTGSHQHPSQQPSHWLLMHACMISPPFHSPQSRRGLHQAPVGGTSGDASRKVRAGKRPGIGWSPPRPMRGSHVARGVHSSTADARRRHALGVGAPFQRR